MVRPQRRDRQVGGREHRSITPIYDRGAPTVSGPPGSVADQAVILPFTMSRISRED